MESIIDRTAVTDAHRRLMGLAPGDNPEWLAFDANRETIYAIADRVSELMGEGMGEDEALLSAYAERCGDAQGRRDRIKAMAARLVAAEDAIEKSLKVCFEPEVERRARAAMPRGKKTLHCLFGTFRFRKTPRAAQWNSDDAAIAWAERNAPKLVELNPRIADKKALQREVEAWAGAHDGALPEGFEWWGGVESFSVSAKAPKDGDE